MDEDFCAWAVEEIAQEADNHEWQGFLTAKQIEAGEVDTGLRGDATAMVLNSQGSQAGWPMEKVIACMAQGL